MNYEQVLSEIINFRNERHWQKYHTLPALARALNIEAGEVSEHFLWQDAKPDDEVVSDSKEKQELEMELADTLTYAYYMCEKLGVNPNDLVHEKLQQNKQRHWRFDDK